MKNLHDSNDLNCVARQNKLETPRDKDEVNKREIREYDGRAHDPDTMVVPLTPKPTRKVVYYEKFYYESRKRNLKTRLIYEYWYDERLKN